MTANNAANVKVRAYRVKYVSGRKPGQKPSKNFKLKLTRSGIKLVGIYPKPFWFGNQMIPWNDIQKIEYSESVETSQFSAGNAVVGGMLFGDVGAIAGAAMGSKEEVMAIKIHYDTTEPKQLVVAVPAYLGDRLRENLTAWLDARPAS